MRTKAILLILLVCPGLAACKGQSRENPEKRPRSCKPKIMTAEAEKLEKSGQLVDARAKYANSLALTEMNGVTDALKHIDEEIRKRIKNDLNPIAQALRGAQISGSRGGAGRKLETTGLPTRAVLRPLALLLPDGRPR